QDKTGIAISLTNEGLLTPVLQIGSGISYMLSMVLIPPLLKKMDKKTLWIWMSLIGAVADIVTFIIGVWIVPYNTVPGVILYTVLRFFTNFPVGMSLVLLIAMFSDTVDDIEMRSKERLEGTVFSFRSLVNKVSIAAFNVAMLKIVEIVGYEATKMASISQDYTVPLITSTTQASIVDGTNYTTVLNVIFFMLTGLGAIGLICQAIPMFFYKFDEKGQEEKLKAFRAEKEKEYQAELDNAMQA
ncbi:MAG: MFS transporter, partial [Eubacterium sp.]|nr:MFS transporter [Eubacterium sp.]